MVCKQNMNQSCIMIIFDINILIDELMLRYDVCSFLFSEIHNWIKTSVKHTWNGGGSKKLVGSQVQVFPTSSTSPPRHFWPKDRKRSRPTRFGR
jgi:hypothetical protein